MCRLICSAAHKFRATTHNISTLVSRNTFIFTLVVFFCAVASSFGDFFISLAKLSRFDVKDLLIFSKNMHIQFRSIFSICGRLVAEMVHKWFRQMSSFTSLNELVCVCCTKRFDHTKLDALYLWAGSPLRSFELFCLICVNAFNSSQRL